MPPFCWNARKMKTPQILHYSFDPKNKGRSDAEPEWKNKIDRWYQLDEISFALCEAAFAWQQTGNLKSFDELIFLSEGGSNLADAEFVATQPTSPSKFVYTLANIAPSVFCHFLNWSGPVFCFCVFKNEFGETTKKRALEMAFKKYEVNQTKTLILESIPRLNANGYRDVYGYFVS